MSDLHTQAQELEPRWVQPKDESAKTLEALRIIVGHGFHDGQSGDLHTVGIVATCVGPYILYTYESGREDWHEFVGQAAAFAELRRLDDMTAQAEGEL